MKTFSNSNTNVLSNMMTLPPEVLEGTKNKTSRNLQVNVLPIVPEEGKWVCAFMYPKDITIERKTVFHSPSVTLFDIIRIG